MKQEEFNRLAEEGKTYMIYKSLQDILKELKKVRLAQGKCTNKK